jgi:hypothetical protein
MDALDGYPLFTITQMLQLISSFGNFAAGAWSDKARHAVAKNAYRLRKRGEPNNRITYRKKQEIIYARTAQDQERWCGADKELMVAALDRTEMRVGRLVSIGIADFADLACAAEAGGEQAEGYGRRRRLSTSPRGGACADPLFLAQRGGTMEGLKWQKY